jgi:hypothetical protein
MKLPELRAQLIDELNNQRNNMILHRAMVEDPYHHGIMRGLRIAIELIDVELVKEVQRFAKISLEYGDSGEKQ